MKKLICVLLLFVVPGVVISQQARYERRGNGAPAGACKVGQTAAEVYINSANGDHYTCKSSDGNPSITGTWVLSGNSAAGTGTVTSVSASGGAETTTGSAITSTGTIRGTSPVNAQTGTTYTVQTGDRGKLVTHSNGSAIAVTLPQAGASFPDGWYYDSANLGAGTATITPTTSTIDGAASLALTTNQGVRIVSNGTNYFTVRGKAAASSGGGSSVLADGASSANVLSAAETKFGTFGPKGSTIAPLGFNSTESQRQMLSPAAGTLKKFVITTTTTQPANGSLVFTLRVNGVDTAVTFTVAADAPAGTYSDTTHTAAVAFGDLISFSILNNSPDTSAASVNRWSVLFEVSP